MKSDVEERPIMVYEDTFSDSFDDNPDVEEDSADIDIRIIQQHRIEKRRRGRLFLTKERLILFSVITVILSISVLIIRTNQGTFFGISQDNMPPIHPSFELIKTKRISERNAIMYLFQHRITKTEFLAYEPDPSTIPSSSSSSSSSKPQLRSDDKVFGISFRTKPKDSTGVPHILEHSVLSGSKKYPVKDPFLHLMKGSLQTFLNAMTYNDRTVYPVASRNTKDFQNLVSVYLDAVFAPRCVDDDGKWIFLQEGWRYDVVDTTSNDDHNKNNPTLEYKGVVYSEMKGVYSDPESVLQRKSEAYLFPDNTYKYDSGGDPAIIPTLSHEEFVEFYRDHYHPTNSKVFVSGTKSDISFVMDLLHNDYLSNYEENTEIRSKSQIDFQPKKFTHHLYISEPYSVSEIDSSSDDDDEGQYMFAITWLLNDKFLDVNEELELYVLDYLLMGTPASPINKMLLESNLGTSVIGDGLSTGLLQATYSIGMKGVRGDEMSILEVRILDALKSCEEFGFDDDDILAAMNFIEFQLREINAGSEPTGITVFLEILSKWNYDLPPESALEFEDALKKLKQNVNAHGSKLFQKLIKDLFLDNNHRIHLELFPSVSLEEEIKTKETGAIQKFKKSLTKDQLEQLIQESIDLKSLQDSPDPHEYVATLPKLSLEDISLVGEEYPIRVFENPLGESVPVTILSHAVSGNQGIVYVDLGIDISSIAYQDIVYLPFLIQLMKESGTNDMTDIEVNQLIGIYTGGIDMELVLQPLVSKDGSVSSQNMVTLLFIRGKCVADNLDHMMSLFLLQLEQSYIDSKEKAIQILEKQISIMKDAIQSSGHSYAVRRMHAKYNAQSLINEQLFGVEQYLSLQATLMEVNDNWNNIKLKIENIRQAIVDSMSSKGTILNLTADSSTLQTVEKPIQDFLTSHIKYKKENRIISDRIMNYHPWLFEAEKNDKMNSSKIPNEGIAVTSQVSYVGKSALIYQNNEQVHGSADVLSHYLKTGYLWENVRMKNGAYGVMMDVNENDGFCYFVSYRDPNVSLTLKVFDETVNFLLDQIQSNTITEEVITQSIIGAIGRIDTSALPPRDVGWISMLRWISGRSAAYRQKWRNEILNSSIDDFSNFADRLTHLASPSIAIVGSESSLEKGASESNMSLSYVNIN